MMKNSFMVNAALLAVLLLASGCTNPFDIPNEFKPSEKEGLFTLNIAGAGRTILPEVYSGDYYAYTLEFRSGGTAGSTAEPLSFDRDISNINDPIRLPEGVYTLTVTALDENAEEVAKGTVYQIAIVSGQKTDRTINLIPIIETGATGTFSWDIRFPLDVVGADVYILPFVEGGKGLFEPREEYEDIDDLITVVVHGDEGNSIEYNRRFRNVDSIELDTGYYRVGFVLYTDTHGSFREEFLHVYKNMDSHFDFEFTEKHFIIELGDDSAGGMQVNLWDMLYEFSGSTSINATTWGGLLTISSFSNYSSVDKLIDAMKSYFSEKYDIEIVTIGQISDDGGTLDITAQTPINPNTMLFITYWGELPNDEPVEVFPTTITISNISATLVGSQVNISLESENSANGFSNTYTIDTSRRITAALTVPAGNYYLVLMFKSTTASMQYYYPQLVDFSKQASHSLDFQQFEPYTQSGGEDQEYSISTTVIGGNESWGIVAGYINVQGSAVAGTTVTFNVNPNLVEGYQLQNISIMNSNNNPIDYKPTTTGSTAVYSFTMPYSNITIVATFSKGGSDPGKPDPIEKTLVGLVINTLPQTEYTVNDYFDPYGMMLQAVYSDGSTMYLSNYDNQLSITITGTTEIYNNIPLSRNNTSITVTYTEYLNGSSNSVSVSIPITVTSPLEGWVDVTGTLMVGETLSVDTTNLGGSGQISYEWMKGTISLGIGATYTLVEDDFDWQILVIVTRSGYSENVYGYTNSPVRALTYNTVTFDSRGVGNTTVSVKYGNTMTPPANPRDPKYYQLNGWFRDPSNSNTMWNFETDTVSYDITLYAQYTLLGEIGDIGPGGGYIFYIAESGLLMYDNSLPFQWNQDLDEWNNYYYLEVSPTIVANVAWTTLSNFQSEDTYGYIHNLGYGRRNTYFILKADPDAPAALACKNYSVPGYEQYNDWFLPSDSELTQLGLFKGDLEVFSYVSGCFWVSNQNTWIFDIDDPFLMIKPSIPNQNVLAIRAF